MKIKMSQTNPYTDVVELCSLLQCLGFHMKSLDVIDGNVSQDGATRTVTINCQASGFHVVLESDNLSCSCPSVSNQQNSGFWQVSGMTGGKQYNKECGSGALRSLSKAHRERLTKQLQEIVRCIQEYNESDVCKEGLNKSASMIEMKTPEKGLLKINTDTPTRYRSLDTLTTKGDTEELPTPGVLQKKSIASNVESNLMQSMYQRQSTYTLSSTPGSTKQRNKTSSPLRAPSSSLLDSMVAAEKMAEDLRSRLSSLIKEYVEDNKPDISISSLALDVSKISVLKIPDISKPQFASSPNLSGIAREDITKRIKRTDSASTSNLASKSVSKEGKVSRLPKISTTLFKRNNSLPTRNEKEKTNVNKSKLNCLIKPKIIPNRTSKADAKPNVSALKRRSPSFKSTIPKPASKKE